MQITYSLSDLEQVSKQLINTIDTNKIVLFHGEVGTGKTTLIKSLVETLGGNAEDVSSPTFSLVNEYEVANGFVYHFDFYRIVNETEIYDIGFEEYVDSGHWIFIEWPEKIKNLLQNNEKNVYLTTKSVDNRFLELKP
jgi:tRNA threonylcarbamoyladenosine biosynthesis protein TsaE